MDHGFFGDLFDFDRDGQLDTLERAADFSMFMGYMEEPETPSSDSWDSDEE